MFVSFLAVYAFFVTQKINLSTADLGRHLKNGEISIRSLSVPDTNLYSYTHPGFPFLNHHWGAGALFFLIERVFGFPGLSLFFTLLSLSAFWLFFDAARRDSGFAPAAFAAAVLIPLMATRTEIRPEGLSYLFCGAFYWLLSNHRRGRVPPRALWALPALEFVWVNTHIYFFLGLMLLGLFVVEYLADALLRKDRDAFRRLKETGLVMLAAVPPCLVNPSGYRGVIAPWHIFQNYGYRVFENQSVWFLERIVSYPPILYFKIAVVLLLLSMVLALMRIGRAFPISQVFLAVIFSTMGGLAVRNFTIFALMAMPLTAANVRIALGRLARLESSRSLLVSLPLILALMCLINKQDFLERRTRFGLGLMEGSNGAADFFKRERIRGPILNNYDIGGYLIYHLYPAQRVFVDNRPEAYPASFFRDVYVPMMEDEAKWKRRDAEYGFNSIFFFRHDLTPHGQSFLVKRVFDPAWAPVYVDAYNIILVRRCRLNQALIAKYEIPQSLFVVGK